jgi:hypothetical protein
LNRNSLPSRHIACMITASLRATAPTHAVGERDDQRIARHQLAHPRLGTEVLALRFILTAVRP